MFETNNNVSVNVLAVEGREIYIPRKSRRTGHKIDLLLVSENGINHYTAIKVFDSYWTFSTELSDTFTNFQSVTQTLHLSVSLFLG